MLYYFIAALWLSNAVPVLSFHLGGRSLNNLGSRSLVSNILRTVISPLSPGCTNGATTRQCWSNGYDINTDSETSWPNTGKCVKYNLVISEKTLSPDGNPKVMQVINGQYPGPTITANWGDTLEITVTNQLTENGTSLHWHGISQKKSNTMDGTNGVTECPLAPGKTKTYKFIANQYGTTWYHSHHAIQYGNGVAGSIVINGPSTSNYDIDLGAYPVSDLYYRSIWDALLDTAALAAVNQHPPSADNGVINGTMMNPAKTAGSYNKVSLQKGKKYRLRLINTSIDNHFRVSLDNHIFTVIQADFVAIQPYNTTWIFLGIGERYDVVFTANQDVDNYWFRAEVQAGCGFNNNNGNILSIFSYDGAPAGNPNTNKTAYTPSCSDETGLVPYVKKDVPQSQFVFPTAQQLTVSGPTTTGQGTSAITHWLINSSAIFSDWKHPTLKYVAEHNSSYLADMNLISLPHANAWSFWVIQDSPSTIPNGRPIPHPIHLHGHDFYLLGAGAGNYTNTTQLNFANPTRRDVAMLPGSGWMVLGFQTDNPGAWLMHCHIGWHASQGFAVQFLERVNDIPSTVNLNVLDPVCQDWKAYSESAEFQESESGV